MKKYIALLLLVSLSTAQAMPLSTALTLCKTYGSAALQLAKTVANSTPFNVALIAGTFVSAYASTKQQQAQEEYHALEVAKALAHKNALDAVLHNITNTSPGNTPINPANLVQDIKAQVDALEATIN